TGNDQVSRLRLSLHCARWSPLYGGPDVGAGARIHGGCGGTIAGTNHEKRLENPPSLARSRLLPGTRYACFARTTPSLLNAREVCGTKNQEKETCARAVPTPAATCRMVPPYVFAQQNVGNVLRLRGLSHLQTPPDAKTQTEKILICGLELP